MMPKSLVLPALAALILPLLGCNKVQARVELKEGNNLYQGEQYKPALEKFQKGLELDPSATFAWRSVGLTALALYRPGDENPQNRDYGSLAITAFEKYLTDFPDDEKVKNYLLSSYVNAKRYDDALAFVDKLPSDPKNNSYKVTILMQSNRLADAYEVAKQGQGEDRLEILDTIARTAWDKAYRDPQYSLEERGKIVDMGLEAEKMVVDGRPNSSEAKVYMGLLLREKAKLELDPTKKLDYITQAEELQKQAVELRKREKEQAAKDAAKDEAAKASASANKA
jgi:tetratricopeptide (TPR) repeat protein